ncbi:hypothetical protein FRB99_007345, partial [Tulasnella sp. 403]
MSDLVTRQVKPGVWTFSRPFLRAPFIPFGGRSTAIKLNDGSVWLLASTKADEETLSKIREIGPVSYIVAPDVVHWLNLKDFSRAFPDAKVIGVSGLEVKVPDVKFAGLYGKDPEGTKYGFEDEINAQYFSAFENKDVAFCHKASKTLIEADLLFNFPPKEQYSKSTESATTWVPLIGRVRPFTWLHKQFLGGLAKDVDQNGKDAKTVASWDFDTIIPCHGAPDADNHGSIRIQDPDAMRNEVWREFLTAPFMKILLDDLSLEPGSWDPRDLELYPYGLLASFFWIALCSKDQFEQDKTGYFKRHVVSQFLVINMAFVNRTTSAFSVTSSSSSCLNVSLALMVSIEDRPALTAFLAYALNGESEGILVPSVVESVLSVFARYGAFITEQGRVSKADPRKVAARCRKLAEDDQYHCQMEAPVLSGLASFMMYAVAIPDSTVFLFHEAKIHTSFFRRCWRYMDEQLLNSADPSPAMRLMLTWAENVATWAVEDSYVKSMVIINLLEESNLMALLGRSQVTKTEVVDA